MKKLFTALVALATAQAAFAANLKPPDVNAYVSIGATYAAGTTINTVGDGSTLWGGTPPAYAIMPADPNPAAPAAGWVIGGAAVAYCNDGVANDGTHNCPNNYVGQEAKFRTQANVTHILYDDPIRNYGEPGTSHCHEFFGNASANAYSTYLTLRNRPSSAAGGGVANGTGYWFPCPVLTNPFADGKNYAVQANFVIIYYTSNPYTLASTLTRIPRGLRYVLGVNMDDPDDLNVKAEITAANAQTGTSGRYSYIDNGWGGWNCFNTGGFVVGSSHLTLVNSDGSDPWAGACLTGYTLSPDVFAPPCWDGTNLWSPGGYKHMRRKIMDSVAGKGVCPTGWWQLPELEIKPQFSHQGFNDYKNWRLSSDNMAATNSGHAVYNGGSFHTDWMGGWNDTLFLTWQQFCTGVNGATSHECNNSTISATQALLTTTVAPDASRNPQTNTSNAFGTASQANMFLLPSTSQGPFTIHVHQ